MTGPPRTLLVAPYLGEFGWELMNWQARVRRMAADPAWRRIIVCAPADRRPLYQPTQIEDNRMVFCPVARLALPGEANDDHRILDDGRPIAPDALRAMAEATARAACREAGLDADAATLLAPDFRSTLWPTSRAYQTFISFRVRQPSAVDVVLVPRRRRTAEARNRPDEWWTDLAGVLWSRGLRVESYPDRLDDAVRMLSRARLAAGASTGGLHLASLCACPHYVWGSGDDVRWTALGITNRQRYETFWNPLGTPCRYDACGWQPDVQYVAERILRSLDEIGLRNEQTRHGWSIKPVWRMKRRLAGLVQSSPPDATGRTRRNDWLPWRLRQLVLHHVV